jgi:hypothetical protein
MMRALLTCMMVLVVSSFLMVGCDRGPAPTQPAVPPAQPEQPVQPPVEGEPAAAAPGAYPLTVCVVSGEPLGSMGKPVVLTHEGSEVQICCAGCEDSFRADPTTFIANVAAARAASSTASN